MSKPKNSALPASAPVAPQACPTDVCQAGKADGVLCANDECDRANGVRPASAPVAGEAKHDTDSVCAWQVWWNQHKGRYTTTRQASIAAFAAGKEWRGAAPQASEAVRDEDTSPIMPDDEEIAGACINASDIDGIAYDGPSFERGYRAALSAQPGAQKNGGGDASLGSAADQIRSRVLTETTIHTSDPYPPSGNKFVGCRTDPPSFAIELPNRWSGPIYTAPSDDEELATLKRLVGKFGGSMYRLAENPWSTGRIILAGELGRAIERRFEALITALILARDAHGVMLMTYPPQDAWKARRVDDAIRDALAGTDGPKK
ncbi:hypothetical protein A7J71_11165 [Achromobacter insolitus]|uniref:hypothetical protein n=1 Tax=Achromobacter insolitus TaxID=217204 RepID=UPI0007C87B61|nr:hypothetical protein [Achromobacter insolitus]OAE72571.1 hypothetical protein A7J71_11165 [Achromobacter insolitus]